MKITKEQFEEFKFQIEMNTFQNRIGDNNLKLALGYIDVRLEE